MESYSSIESTCPNCARQADPESRFCKYCGHDLAKPIQANTQMAQTPSRKIIIMLGVAVLVVGLIVVVSLWKKNATASGTNSSASSPGATSQFASSPIPSKMELTRDAVLNLVKGRMTKNVVAVMPSMALQIEPPTWQVFNQMANANVIVCERSMLGDFASCKPGPNGKELKLRGKGMGAVLDLSIGRKVPSVAGISRPDGTSALAQVNLTFEPSGGYEFFKRYQNAFKANPMYGAGYDIDNEQHTVHLRLYDDGWRIEKID